MKRTLTLLVAVVGVASLFALGLVPSVPPAPAAGSNLNGGEGCSNASLEGRYALWSDGTNVPSGTPVRGVGFATFDGEGNLSVTNTVNNNGTIVEDQTFEATYAVNQDCTGRIETASAHWAMVLIDEGEQVVLLRIDPGRVATVFYKKQSSGHEKKQGQNEE